MGAKKIKLVEEDGCQLKVVHLERVARARKEVQAMEETEAMARIFKALGDPTRLGILSALLGGEMCVCDLAAFLGLSDSATSHQLRRLRDLALVRTRRQGQVLYYSLQDEHVYQLIRICLDHVRH
ncbi:MAG: metalloregulator ArsR/SmtB family transcription factor [Desulfarculaceae bacterium]|jgi:DNA-binding transcriptional ArsR family regulator